MLTRSPYGSSKACQVRMGPEQPRPAAVDIRARGGLSVDNQNGRIAFRSRVSGMELTPFHGPPATAPRVPGFLTRTLLGFGTHGEVWLADDLSTGGTVALKIGRRAPDHPPASGDPPDWRPEQETALLCRIDHPHIVRLQRVVPLPQGGLAMVLDLAAGGSLASLVAARGCFDPGEVTTLLIPLADALDYLHRQGVVHSDIAPGNVLFTGDGRPQLGDLGVARVLVNRV